MKLTVLLTDCLQALEPVQTEMTKGATENLLHLTATNSHITFTIYKHEITWTQTIDATITTPGTFLAPLKPFTDFLRSLKGETLSLQTKDDKLLATSQKTKITFHPSNPNTFILGPTNPEPYAPLASFTPNSLQIILQAAIILTTSEKAPQPQYHCSIWTISPDEKPTLTIQASDTFRIFHWTDPITLLSDTLDDPLTMYIPPSTTRLLIACLKQAPPDSQLTIMPQSSTVTFQMGSTIITSRLLQHTFAKNLPIPNYHEEPTYEFHKDPFIHTIRCARLTTGRDAYRITMKPQNHTIQISSDNPGLSDSQHELDVLSSKTNPGTQLHINPDFLLDACFPVPAKIFHLTVKGDHDPLLISSPEHQGFYHLIAPIKP